MATVVVKMMKNRVAPLTCRNSAKLTALPMQGHCNRYIEKLNLPARMTAVLIRYLPAPFAKHAATKPNANEKSEISVER